ncbi:hypothetical protein JY97_00525 [Alkalispirochaeta odontotermitis]|nr:hypothetical protein JY97_00525 [Alkalispirochaeta odontotermitis]
MSKALENAVAKMEAEWAFKAELDKRCEADAVYSNARALYEANNTDTPSFIKIVEHYESGCAKRQALALRTMSKRRAEISIQMKSTQSEAA